MNNDQKKWILVIAPHADDEILGCGGMMARAADAGHEVIVAIVTRGRPPLFEERYTQAVFAQLEEAHKILGVTRTIALDLPSCQLDTIPHGVLNARLVELLKEVEPDELYIPFAGDLHRDHQLVALSAMVAARPPQAHAPRAIFAYETVSETNWNAPLVAPTFAPQVFCDITDTLETKLAAMAAMPAQLKAFPHERSLEALRALATLRGATVNVPAAEAFMLLRQVM